MLANKLDDYPGNDDDYDDDDDDDDDDDVDDVDDVGSPCFCFALLSLHC